ncbi:MAG TPA: FGGY family carbohydrate kinase [Terrimesophilobacter sp.]|nr:FGGY family carbohydrate kinase [Terrimesophilobacter sp.]
MSGNDIVVGIDLGTSSVKVVAVSSHGRVEAHSRRSYPTMRPVPGAAEQNPADWIEAVTHSLRDIARQCSPARWAAIGLSGMLPTMVTLNSRNEPNGNAITWEDGRAEWAAAEFRARNGPELYLRTGARVDGRYLLPMFARLRKDSPARAHDTARVVSAKDYLFFVLTGELLTDPSTAAGYGCYSLPDAAWDENTADLPGVPDVAPATLWRGLRADFARTIGAPAGLPVVLGAADSVLGAYGLGAHSPGDISYIAGTSTVVLGRSARFLPDAAGRYLITPLERSEFGLEMDLLATGSAIDWLATLLGEADAGSLVDLAARVPPEDAPTFLPYLAPGEQGALWMPTLTGSLLGLTLGSTGAQIARGLLTGILLESRRCIGVLAETDPRFSAGRLLVSGSSASAGAFRQDLADATGLPVCGSATQMDHSALGAAQLAGEVSNVDVGDSRGSLELTAPRADRAAMWSSLFRRHDEFRKSLTEGAPDD